MSYCSGAMISGEGKLSLINGQINDVNFKFNSDRKYFLSLDQSTTCTGVYFTDDSASFHLLLDLARMGTPKEEFFRQLKFFLIRLVTGLDIDIFLLEDIPNTDDRHTKMVLRDLKRLIASWRGHIPELDRALHETILPQTWKKEIADRSKGTRRDSSKSKIAEDLCDKLPELQEFLKVYKGEGYDCFDACGMLYGYLLSRYTGEGDRLIMGPLNKGFSYEVYYVEDKIEELTEVIGILTRDGIEVVERKWNQDYSIRDNCRMASGTNVVTVSLINDDTLRTRLLWEFDLPLFSNCYCVILRKTYVDYGIRMMLLDISKNRMEVF